MPVFVGDAVRHPRAADREKPEGRPRRILESFVRIDVDVRRMVDDEEAQAIEEHRFLELVGHADLVTAVPRLELAPIDAHVFIRDPAC